MKKSAQKNKNVIKMAHFSVELVVKNFLKLSLVHENFI